MMKIILVAVPTAVLAFTAGVWTAGGRHPEPTVGARLTILPSEMERNLKPGDLPVQYMKGDYN